MKITKRVTVLLLLLLAIGMVSFGCGEDEISNAKVSPIAKVTVAPNESTDEPTQKPTADATAEKTGEQNSDATEKATEKPEVSATVEATKDSATESAKTPTKAPTKTPVKTGIKSPAKTPTKTATKTPTKTATKTPTKAPTKTPTKAPTAAPTGGSSETITYQQLVNNLMREAQIVADFIKAQNFIYGDARINPALNWIGLDAVSAINPSEKTVSCDRLVGWIFYRAGFTDQPYTQGLTCHPFPAWCEEQGFTKITNVSQLKAGDIVFVNPNKNYQPEHVFLCASSNLGGNVYLRYDAGSNERIQCRKGTEATPGKQPFKEGIVNFMYAYRPTTKNINLDAVFATPPSATVATPKSNATQVFTGANHTWDGGATAHSLNYKYEPGKGYGQYELHYRLSSVPRTSDTNYWNSCYVGVRMPSTNNLPFTGKGGIWISFSDTQASVYFGGTTDWNFRETGVSLPVNVSTARDFIIVDNGEYIKCYIVVNNTRTLLLTIKVEDSGKVLIWNGKGNFIYSGTATINSWCYFTTANHHANSTVSNIKIYGAN